MMTCPACGTQYSDDTLKFCLQDGSVLNLAQQAGRNSNPEIVTQVRSSGQPAETRFMEGQSQVTHVSSIDHSASGPPASGPGKTALAVGVTAAVMIVLFAFVGLAAYVVLRNMGTTNTNSVPNKNTDLSNFFVSTPGPTPSPSPTSTRVPSTPTPTPASTPVATPVPRQFSSYPSTTRLKFGRGSYSTSFSGDVNPGDSRSLVLACKYGQTLSATVSGGGCITFRSGGTSMRSTTSSGDNYLYLTNNCQQVTRFTVSVSVL